MGVGKAEERAFQEVRQHEQMQGSWKHWVGKSVAQSGQEVKVRVGVMRMKWEGQVEVLDVRLTRGEFSVS